MFLLRMVSPFMYMQCSHRSFLSHIIRCFKDVIGTCKHLRYLIMGFIGTAILRVHLSSKQSILLVTSLKSGRVGELPTISSE